MQLRANKMTTLSKLKPGESGVVNQVKAGNGYDPDLMEMGLMNGTLVRMVKCAPLGDPMEICVRGYHLVLRKKQAEAIFIEK